MHQVFAAARVWQLEHIDRLPNHAKVTAHRIFGVERWRKILASCESHKFKNLEDGRDNLLQLCYETLQTSGFKDSPTDETRTLANMELASIVYVDEQIYKMENWPIYVANKKDPKSLVGIEQHFDVVLEYDDALCIRYIGTIDGLVLNRNRGDRLTLDENKTANRIGDGWQLSFDMSNQITGYCGASTTVFGFPVFHSRVTGLKIKPTNRGEDCVPIEPVSRNAESIRLWGGWVRHTVQEYERYVGDYENAPRYTHSCMRYFRPCALLSFCADTPEGRSEQFDQMVPADLSPSERAVQDV